KRDCSSDVCSSDLKLVKVGLDHSIVNLAVLIRLSSKPPLCVLIACDHIGRPVFQPAEALSKILIDLRQCLLFLQTFSIRRIGNNKSVRLWMSQIPDRPLLEVDQMVYPCVYRVFPGGTDDLRLNALTL